MEVANARPVWAKGPTNNRLRMIFASIAITAILTAALPAHALIGSSPLVCDQNILVDPKDDPVAAIDPKVDPVVTILKAGYTTVTDSRAFTITITEMKVGEVAVIDPTAKTVTILKSGYGMVQPCEG